MQRKKFSHRVAEMIINFILRGLFGFLCIYFANEVLETFPFIAPRIPMISYNLYTFCASGMLGLPGVLLMYFLQFWI